MAIELHRFLKVVNEEDEMLIDLLLPKSDEIRKIISNALEAESEEEGGRYDENRTGQGT